MFTSLQIFPSSFIYLLSLSLSPALTCLLSLSLSLFYGSYYYFYLYFIASCGALFTRLFTYISPPALLQQLLLRLTASKNCDCDCDCSVSLTLSLSPFLVLLPASPLLSL
ncbi:hypothetical protein HOY80DRAFT_700171 [Tuber brumale]|nr:hypothetical protein HOY80DRAFT_700171 [Tuber brumale]